MIFQALCGFLPFLDAISDSVTNLHSSIAFEGPVYSRQYVSGLNDNVDNDEAKSTRVIEDDDSDDALVWQLCWTLDLLDTSHAHVDLVFPCACRAHTASVAGSRPRSRSSRGGSSLRRLAATEHLTYAVVVATLQVFLHLTRANITALFLPMLAQATGGGGCGRSSAAQMMGDAVVVVVTTCGVVGSALAARELGREAMCAISGVLVVLCQVRAPYIHTTDGHGGKQARDGR